MGSMWDVWHLQGVSACIPAGDRVAQLWMLLNADGTKPEHSVSTQGQGPADVTCCEAPCELLLLLLPRVIVMQSSLVPGLC